VFCIDAVSAVSGWFKVAPALDKDTVEKFFQHKVLKMPLRKGKITEEVVELILSWCGIPGSMCIAVPGFNPATKMPWRTSRGMWSWRPSPRRE
jgi:hypothetical protein